MEAIARKRFIRQSPYKIRYVLKTIKGLNVGDAINKLSLTNKKASIYIKEVLKASISNMIDKNSMTIYGKNKIETTTRDFHLFGTVYEEFLRFLQEEKGKSRLLKLFLDGKILSNERCSLRRSCFPEKPVCFF